MDKDAPRETHLKTAPVKPPHVRGRSSETSTVAVNVCDLPAPGQLPDDLARLPLENPNPILRISREGVVLFANPASHRCFPEWELAPGGLAPEHLRSWIDVAFLSRETYPQELPWRGRWYLWLFVPLPNVDYANIYGFEITEQKNAERAREETLVELERKNAELERFAYVVSHDLKTPLITIRGFLDHLERDVAGGRPDRITDDIARIRNAAGKMQQRLDDLLQLSRIGRVINPPEVIPLAELVREAIELTAGALSRYQAQVSVAPNLPLVWGARQRLLEVFQNLIDNAAKFMGDQAHPQIEIGVRGVDEKGAGSNLCEAPGTYRGLVEPFRQKRPIPFSTDPLPGGCICFVRDNGKGIDPCDHQRVFELFEKLEPENDGAGVGLALVKRILEWHGGRVWVESEGRGQGSTFCFYLPPRREDTHHGS